MSTIAIIGYGKSGRGAEKLAQAHKHHCDVFCDNDASQDTCFSRYDLIVVSPGVPPKSKLYTEAAASGKEIISELEFAFRMCPRPVLAITGTNGKTTSCELCCGILNAAGVNAQCCGNIGNSFSDALCTSQELMPEVFVLEVSSFQLEKVKEFAPFAAAITNIAEDHLDRYDNSFENYRKTKEKIFAKVAADKCFTPDSPCRCDKRYFAGFKHRHERENAIVALNLAAAFAGTEKIMCDNVLNFLNNFKSQPHRQELFLKKNLVSFVDDSKATNVSSAIAAIDAFSGDFKEIFLILGGLDKAMDFSPLISRKNHITEIFIYGECRNKIYRQLQGCCKCQVFEKFDDAAAAAIKNATANSLVLLSPACASMDQFTDYRARGKRFKAIAENATL